jgi:hypothetical protein
MSQLNRRNALALVASLPAIAVPGGRNIGTRSEAAIEAHKAARSGVQSLWWRGGNGWN